jgi:gluconate 2-dehydrogenase gamma chain
MPQGALADEQALTLRAICDRVVPSDATGPGALDAGAPNYIELALESDYASLLPLYERGIRGLDERARDRHGDGFATLDGAARDALLRELESEPIGSEARTFFETVRDHTIEGMFGDPRWGGNRSGAGWKLIGYRQPRLTWSAADQAITPLVAGEHPG